MFLIFVMFDNFAQLSSLTFNIFSNSAAVSVLGGSRAKMKQGIKIGEFVEVDSIICYDTRFTAKISELIY